MKAAKSRNLALGEPVTGFGVSLTDVSVKLGEVTVLKRLTLNLASGSKTLLVGANGAGKSQLLKLLVGEIWPSPHAKTARQYFSSPNVPIVLREAKPRLQLVSPERQDRYERYQWNFSTQTVVGTGCKNLDAPLGALSAGELTTTEQCLKQVGAWALKDRPFLCLSYGQRRLVLLARALAANPAVLLLDEVYNGLDSAHRQQLNRVFDQLCQTPITIVCAAHRDTDAHPALTDALAISRGQLQYHGPREQLPKPWSTHIDPGADAYAHEILTDLLPAQISPKAQPTKPKDALIKLINASIYRDYQPVIRRLNWTVAHGQSWAIIGANGAGKTTLLQALHGRLPVAADGHFQRRGHQKTDRLEDWQQRVQYLGPDEHIKAQTYSTLLEVVLTGIPTLRRLDAKPTPLQIRQARSSLRRVGLWHLSHRNPREVSYGQMRLALLARVLIRLPEALLLDEPLTGLDTATRQQVKGLLRDIIRCETQIIAAVHHDDDLIPEISYRLHLPSGQIKRLIQEQASEA